MILGRDRGPQKKRRALRIHTKRFGLIPRLLSTLVNRFGWSSSQLTQLEHILKRPDTYVGSVERSERHMWVFDSAATSMVWKSVTMVPGLYKIFDEILVNAADNKIRDPKMDTLKVTVDKATNTISVYNNGRGIPIEIHSVCHLSDCSYLKSRRIYSQPRRKRKFMFRSWSLVTFSPLPTMTMTRKRLLVVVMVMVQSSVISSVLSSP